VTQITTDGRTLAACYQSIRRETDALCEHLEPEDCVLQSMPDASPVKWHLAHTTWFFETFILSPFRPHYRAFHPQFRFLFNSYYNEVGPRWPRPDRGLLSRPTLSEVADYRAYVDRHMLELLEAEALDVALDDASTNLKATVVLGLNHEQQHQELIVTDLKHAFSANPLRPVYRELLPTTGNLPPSKWLTYPEGLLQIGHNGRGFAFDNESPRHEVYLRPFQLSSRPVSNGEFISFIEDGGYDRAELWLSDGWAARQAQGWTAPLYWQQTSPGNWSAVTLGGFLPVDPDEPVCHISFYEADAFARWAGARLPTEAEWESAAASMPVAGNFLESRRFHPSPVSSADDDGPLQKLYGDVWQWTASPYIGYPGYRPAAGALGEYNGKFMCNQFVLRGASCVTPRSHSRLTYRNFFPPAARWQFSGLRLAKDIL